MDKNRICDLSWSVAGASIGIAIVLWLVADGRSPFLLASQIRIEGRIQPRAIQIMKKGCTVIACNRDIRSEIRSGKGRVGCRLL